MKKLISSLLIAILLTIPSGAAAAAGTPQIVEVPAVKIIMDGKITKYNDVPICVGQNTLLPLRELFNHLGVTDENIRYDDKKKSVTVTKDQTRIYMEVGSGIALVNDMPVKLNAAPVGYAKNQRIYIPFRFAAETLGKKVVWDGSSNAILVCDAARYESVRQLLERSDAAMEEVNRCKVNIVVDGTVKTGQASMELGVDAGSMIDKAGRAMSMNMVMRILGMELATDAYYKDNVSYISNPLEGKWEKKTYTKAEYDKLFASQSSMDMLEAREALYAGLVRSEDGRPDEILLKGDVYPGELLNRAMAGQQAGTVLTTAKAADLNAFYVEISIDADSYLVNRIAMNVSSVQTNEKATVKTEVAVKVVYSNYNDNFQIIIPQDAIKNAVEKKPAVSP